MKRFKMMTMAALVIALAVPAAALAKPQVSVSMTAQKEVVVTTKEGKKETKFVPADQVTSGEIVSYLIEYRNQGTEAASNVVVDNPIPEGTAYLANSATEQGADISFSIDGGKSYKKPTLLTYEVKKPDGSTEKRVATPDHYTNIRWVVDTVPAGAVGKVGYKVRVK